MKKLFSFLFLTVCFNLLFAGNIDEATAIKVAHNFYYERISQYEPIAHENILTGDIFTIVYEGSTLVYAVNINIGGFVLVSGYNNVRPVIAYSFKGKYSEQGHPPQFNDWLERYKQQILYTREQHIRPGTEIIRMWERLSSDDLSGLQPLKIEKDVEPLLTTQWNQGQYYNEMCPADPAGPGGHCYAGCVATALGQVVNYFRWPITGLGSYSYSCPPYGTLSADFENTTYEWDKMATSLDKSNLAVALLLNHLGISCDMVYGPNGSGMYNHKAAYTLRTHFKYSPETIYVYRDNTSMDWDSLLVTHLDKKIPMYYAGWSVPNVNGHAFVCDGYQAGNYYHFNWGWSGSYDGYFYTDDLSPGGSNFNLAQELIINGFPDTNLYSYPDYCQGNKLLDGTDGTIDDGSGPVYEYLDGTDCSWLIAPEDSVENITLEFLSFNTSNGDLVTVYDGESSASPVLGTFQGPDLPDEVTSSGDKLFITFSADGNNTAEGWLLSYTAEIPVYCSGMTNLVEQTDTFSDGSGPRDYHNGTTCMWMINPPGASETTVYFTSFNTEEDMDVVKVFDLATQELLAEYSGDITPDPVTSLSGGIFVTFSTNYNTTAPGWDAYYETDLVSISEHNNAIKLEIFPNPAKGHVNLSWVASQTTDASISISSMNGIEIYREKAQSRKGSNMLQIDVSNFTSGIYIIEISIGKEIMQRKLLVR